MDQHTVTECIMTIREDVAKIKQKLDTDYTLIRSMAETVSSHESRISRMEASRKSVMSTLAVVGTIVLDVVTLSLAIIALLKK